MTNDFDIRFAIIDTRRKMPSLKAVSLKTSDPSLTMCRRLFVFYNSFKIRRVFELLSCGSLILILVPHKRFVLLYPKHIHD